MYFNGNYGNYWQLDNETNMRLSDKEVAIATRAYVKEGRGNTKPSGGWCSQFLGFVGPARRTPPR